MIDDKAECFPEASGEGKWFSYADLGRIRGIGRESAVKLVHREGWRRIKGNDGAARILVPLDWLKPARRVGAELPPERTPEVSRMAIVLEAAVAALGERAEAAERRAERAEQARDAAEHRAAHEREDMLDAESRARRAVTEQQVAESRAAEAEKRAGQAALAKEAAEQASNHERARAHERQSQVEVMESRLAASLEMVNAAEAIRQADGARRALGRFARLRLAWRGL
jgi:hypothetical protein